MGTDNLFENRTPGAAATQLATVLAYATEMQLLTLERLPRSTSAGSRRWHGQVARRLVFHCKELGVSPRGLMGHECPRLALYLMPHMEWWLNELKPLTEGHK